MPTYHVETVRGHSTRVDAHSVDFGEDLVAFVDESGDALLLIPYSELSYAKVIDTEKRGSINPGPIKADEAILAEAHARALAKAAGMARWKP